jgi:cell division protein FtsW
MLNIGVALGLVPTTGVPLPFLSYGGSSLVVSMVALGMLLNVSQHSS